MSLQLNTVIMEQRKQPVERFYYSEDEWARLGCGPLPPERDRSLLQTNNKQKDTIPSTNNRA